MKLLEHSGPPATPPAGSRRRGGVEMSSKNPASFMPYGLLGLGLHGDPRAIPLGRRIFREERHPVARHNAAIALALLLRSAAVPELLKTLEETGTQYTKAAVVMALGLLARPTEELVSGLIDAYRDDSHPDAVRALAIIGLGSLGDPRAIPLSATLTRNYNYHIRSLALDEVALLQ